MSDFRNGELSPNHYKRTLVAYSERNNENNIIWIEGTNMELSFNKLNHHDIGICGGSINTNTGFTFTKEQLLEIVNKMEDGSRLICAACNDLNISGVVKEFEQSNTMIQNSPNGFAPPSWFEEHPETKPYVNKYWIK